MLELLGGQAQAQVVELLLGLGLYLCVRQAVLSIGWRSRRRRPPSRRRRAPLIYDINLVPLYYRRVDNYKSQAAFENCPSALLRLPH